MSLTFVLLSGLAALAAYGLRRLLSNDEPRKGLRYPPGPPGWPDLGNMQRFPGPTWETYHRWSEEYGSDLILLKAFGTPTLIVSSFAASKELLEKRSAIYSDRPVSQLTMLMELVGLKWNFGLLPYGNEWRDGRRSFHRVFNQGTVPMFRPTEVTEARKLLRRILHNPQEYMSHLRLMSGSTSISIAYGFNTLEENDPYIRHAEETMTIINSAYPGVFMVDHFPFLKHLPEWFPGAGFKTTARLWKEKVMWTLNVPWEQTKERMRTDPSNVTDSAAKSFIQDASESTADSAYMERIAKATAASIYLAGSDTAVAILETFLLAMILYPDIQRRAQEHLDQICEGNLPDFADYDSLSYIHAVLKESLRWHPVAALNVPHRVMEDDVYEGQFIPRGATVIVNNWALLHDPEIYSNPYEFFPERYLKPDKLGDGSTLALNPDAPDPMNIAFGFGRRICPGRFMAYESMWITIASILSSFNIEKAKDANGDDITPPKIFREEGFASRPLPFSCRLVPRSPEHEVMVLRSEVAF